MIKDDIEVIKSALLGEELHLPKKQLLNNTIKINSNRNLNIESSENICDYKLNCYSNIFDNFEIYFNSMLNMTNSKEKIFNKIKETASIKSKIQSDLDVSIEKIKDFYLRNSIKEEIFKTHILNKQSANFGKVSNYFFKKILNEERSSNYKENRLLGRSQDTYFEFFNKDLLSTDNFKKYFLINIDKLYDESNNISNTNSININTYICQNLINITKSLFTLHSGALENIPVNCHTNIIDNSLNLICTTSETNSLNYFNHVNTKSMYFDYNSFYDNDYIQWRNDRQGYEIIDEDDVSNVSNVPRSMSSATSYNTRVEPDNMLGREAKIVTQKKLNVSNDTFEILDNSISDNITRHLKIYDEFYRTSSRLSDDGSFWVHPNISEEAEYADAIREIMKAFTDIYSFDITAVNSLENSYLKKWIYMQGRLKGNARFTSDLNVVDNNYYDSINYQSITKRYLETYELNQALKNMQEELDETEANELGQTITLDLSNSTNAEEIRLLREINSEYVHPIHYNENKLEIFNSALDDRYGNMAADIINAVCLRYLSYNIDSNQSMIYYANRPIYEIYTPNFDVNDNNFNEKLGAENDYSIFNKDLINTKIRKGSNYLALKTDCLVKKAKINSLRKSNVDISLFEELSKNISEKITVNKMIAYSNDVDSDLTLTEPDDQLFDILFTKDNNVEDKFYSNFSITHKEEGFTKFSNYLELVKNKIEDNGNIENTVKVFSNILKNYYKGKYFKTSSCLIKNIISDVIKEPKDTTIKTFKSTISDVRHYKYDELALCQYLYLYFFKSKSTSKNSSESYEVVAKRFIKKAIEKSRQYSGTEKFKEYKFNLDDIDINEYSLDPDGDPADNKNKLKDHEKDFFTKYFDTSESLKIIKNNVFSNKNLNKLKGRFNFQKVQNLSINILAQQSFEELTANLDYSDFDFDQDRTIRTNVLEDLRGDAYNVLLNKIGQSLESSKLEVKFDLIKNIMPFRYFFKNCKLNNERSFASREVSYDFSVINIKPFKYQLSVNDLPNIGDRSYNEGTISIKYYLKSGSDGSKQGFIRNRIDDLFDEIFDNNKLQNLVFNSISLKILDLIKTIDLDFIDKEFETEEDVDKFLDENNHLTDIVIELLEVYGEIYCAYIDNLNQESTLRLLSYSSIDKDNSFRRMTEGANRLYPFDTRFHFERSSWRNDLLNDSVCKNSVAELERLYDYYNENSQDFIDNSNLLVTENKLDFSRDLEKVLKTLTTSDVFQSISFDFIMQCLNFYFNTTKNISYSDLKDETSINDSDFDIEKIIMNVFDSLYMNSFYNKKLFLKHYNDHFYESVKPLLTSSSLLNVDVFNVDKQKELRKIKSLNVFPANKDLINSDLYSYVVNLEDLKGVSYDSIIKIKIEIIDHSRLDRVFLPKVLYFSPMLFANDIYISDIENQRNGKIGFYDISEDNDSRLKYLDLESLKKLNFFRSIIVDKFKIRSLELNNLSNKVKYDLIIDEIYNNHIKSNSIENLIDVFYNIKLDEKQISNKITSSTYNMIRSTLDNDEFFDLFNTNKDRFFESCFTFIEEEDCYLIKSTKVKYEKISMFFMYLNNIVSEKSDSYIFNSIENYINLNFNILTNEFIFVLNNSDLTLENNDENTTIIRTSDISNIDLIKYYLENVDVDSLTEYGIYRFNDIENVDNYSISITSKVI